MGLLDFLRPRETFSQQWSASDPAFAAWWRGTDDVQESVTPYTVLGLAAVQRAVSIISGTIAGLPLKTYERDDSGEKTQIDSPFDDPYPGIDGMTPFAWVETVLIHSLIWRHAFLWHEARADGTPGLAYRPLNPDIILAVRRDASGRRVFEYRESGSMETKEVGSEQITYIPGPSLDGTSAHPLLYNARAVFSAAISADKTTQRNLRKGIRIGGVVTPGDAEEDFDPTEGAAILEQLRGSVMGSDNAGDIAVINRRLKLERWTSSNIEAQWHETLMYVLMQIEQIFGVPPHLMADTEKQTSWGTGVAEQNLSLSRFTLRAWSDRIEQTLSLRLPPGQFVEFDYKGLLQGTPQQEIELLLAQVDGGLLTHDEARAILNRPPLTAAQRAASAPPPVIAPPVIAPPESIAASRVAEPDRASDLTRYAEIQQRGFDGLLAALASREPITPGETHFHVDAATTIAPGAVQVAPADIHVDATTTIEQGALTFAEGAIRNESVNPEVMVIEAPEVVPTRTVIDRDADGQITGSHEEPV